MARVIHRRALLAAAAGVPAIAALSVAQSWAWSVEEADVATSALFRAGRSCGDGDPRHPQVLADLRARLAEAGLSAAEQDKAIDVFRCPVCGCPVTT